MNISHHNISVVNVSRETFDIVDHLWTHYRAELHQYTTQLHWWNARLNLVSRNASMLVLEEHVKHSLLIASLDSFHSCNGFIDIGTGGGLPSLPLAIAEYEKEYIGLDIVEKKVMALNDIVRKLGITNYESVCADIHSYTWDTSKYQAIISKHAFKLNEVWDSLKNQDWQYMFFLKGSDYKEELSRISEPLSVTAHNLQTGTIKSFYAGKYLLEISR